MEKTLVRYYANHLISGGGGGGGALWSFLGGGGVLAPGSTEKIFFKLKLHSGSCQKKILFAGPDDHLY